VGSLAKMSFKEAEKENLNASNSLPSTHPAEEELLLSGKQFSEANSFPFFFPKANGGPTCNSA